MSRRIIVVDSGFSIIDRAISKGYSILYITTKEDYDKELENYVTGIVQFRGDFGLLFNLISKEHVQSPYDAVISLAESGLLIAAHIRNFLKLSGVGPYAIKTTQDKLAMRRALAGIGNSVQAVPVSCKNDIISFSSSVGWPIIVKPRTGTGSEGVKIFTSPQAIDEIDVEQDYIAEEFIDGDEYSVEMFSFNGNHIIITVNKEEKLDQEKGNKFLEIGHKLPALLTQKILSRIERYVATVLTKLGITDGPSHTEVILTADGQPRLVETHARLAGDKIPTLIQLSTGIDLVDISIDWPLKAVSPLTSTPQPKRGAAIRYFTPSPGTVSRVSGFSQWRYAPGVVDINLLVKVGDIISPFEQSDHRVGYVITVGENADAAAKLAYDVASSAKIEITRGAIQ